MACLHITSSSYAAVYQVFASCNIFVRKFNSQTSRCRKVSTTIANPVYHALVYSWTFVAPEPHPLAGAKYIGQVVRPTDSYDLALKFRCAEHRALARRNGKKVGFHALLEQYPDSWEIRVLEKSLYHSAVDAVSWADDRERAAIKKFGGPLRDTQQSCRQTLNLTIGGRGDPLPFLYYQEAYRSARWGCFLAALRSFRAREGHCRVPSVHNECGYNLGFAINRVCSVGTFIRGCPDRRQVLQDLGFVFSEVEAKWNDFLEALRSFRIREGHCRVPRAHKEGDYNLGVVVNRVRSRGTFIHSCSDRRQVLQDLGFVFSEDDAKWEDFFEALRAFRSHEGHCRVPGNHKVGNYNLGAAVRNLRNYGSFTRGRLDRCRALEAIGFVHSEREAQWEDFLTALRTFRAREGHCRVPWNHKVGEYNLGAAVLRVRSRGDFIHSRLDRRRLLNDIGFVFNAAQAKWEHFLEALRSFKSREGHCRVPIWYKEGNYSLGHAVSSVRSKHTFIRGCLHRRCALEDMGFVFNEHAAKWEDFLQALSSFKTREGHCRVPRAHMESEYNLGNAVHHVRSLGSFIRSCGNRRRTLEDMGFVFEAANAKWQDFLEALRSFSIREGHCLVPRKHKEGNYNLGGAVSRVRSRGTFIRGCPNRHQVLQDIGFVFNECDQVGGLP